MKYYYKIFVNNGVEESLKSINVTESFIKDLTESSIFNDYIKDQNMTEFYVCYDLDIVRKGKMPWTWASHNYRYKVNCTFKGEVHPQRKDKINKLKELWKNDE